MPRRCCCWAGCSWLQQPKLSWNRLSQGDDFLARPSVLAKFQRRQPPCPANFQLAQPRAGASSLLPCWVPPHRCSPFLEAASGLGCCDPNGREAVWWVRKPKLHNKYKLASAREMEGIKTICCWWPL